MGWSYGWKTRRELLCHLLSKDRNGPHLESVGHCCRGNVLWSLWRFTDDYGPFGPGDTFIACDVLGKDATGWGYQAYVEADNPPYLSCPTDYLELASDACTEWRGRIATANGCQELAPIRYPSASIKPFVALSRTASSVRQPSVMETNNVIGKSIPFG